MNTEKKKLKVLFVCTGNACRSQMAEGWARHLKGDVIEAFSAGVYPVGVSQRAAQVMAEAGVDISRQWCKHVDGLHKIEFDHVVIMCDNAAAQRPVFGGKPKVMRRTFSDPTFLMGSEEEVLAAHRRTRDEIRAFVETLPESLEL
jgi:arsenate reductase